MINVCRQKKLPISSLVLSLVICRSTNQPPVVRSRIASGGTRDGDTVVGASVITDQDEASPKRLWHILATEYPAKGCRGKGMKTANVKEKNGSLAGLLTVKGDEDLMIITESAIREQTLPIFHKQDAWRELR